MNRDFVLAATFAATTHAAMFFGFPPAVRKPPPAPPATEMIDLKDFRIPPEPPDPAEVIIAPDKDSAPTKPEPPPPRLVDVPVPVKETDFVTRVTPTPDVKVDPDVRIFRIPTDSSGRIGPGTTAIVPASWLDSTPRARVQGPPTYPPEARREGLRGEVVVEFTVDENGRVVDARAVRSTSSVFEAAAVSGVLRWRFEPGRRAGEVVRFRMMVPVVFNLTE